MERQIQMQYQMQKRQIAMQLAGSRDTCHWISAFYATIATGLIAGYVTFIFTDIYFFFWLMQSEKNSGDLVEDGEKNRMYVIDFERC